MTNSVSKAPPAQENQPENGTSPITRSPSTFLTAGVILAWAVDLLFWQKPAGISIAIWVTLALLGVYLLAHNEKTRHHKFSTLLTLAILAMTAMTVLRMESFTRFVNTSLALGGLILLAATFTNGHWFYYRVVDYFVPILLTIFGGLDRPGQVLTQPASDETENGKRSTFSRIMHRFLPILRGVLIAAPIVLILGALLSEADMVFADRLESFFDLFDLERLPEYLFRTFYILVLSYVFIGIFLQAVLPRKTAKQPDPSQTWIPSFLGWTESAIVLGSIIMLFAVFVTIQFRYLFGGQANITALGYTYSEYARRGFGELVTVAVLSLLIYLTLASVTRTRNQGQKRGFSILSTLLMLLVLVMLASSLQRLLLYEGAYGFTRLRTYTHVFIFCLAALLIAAIALELTGKRGRFGLALLAFNFTFALALGVMNVDAFIARQNIQRELKSSTQDSQTLDVAYLTDLSNDAVPVIVEGYQNPQLPAATRERLGAELACRLTLAASEGEYHWQSYHPANVRAIRMLNQVSTQLFDTYDVYKDEYGLLYVPLGDKFHYCEQIDFWLD